MRAHTSPPFARRARAQAKAPKKCFYVSYCLTEQMAAEALAEETSAKYMVKLEEKACSLRINVYSPDKVRAHARAADAAGRRRHPPRSLTCLA